MGCRCCISKWCDQINDRLAPKALKKFSSCFPFFVFLVFCILYFTHYWQRQRSEILLSRSRCQNSSNWDSRWQRSMQPVVGGTLRLFTFPSTFQLCRKESTQFIGIGGGGREKTPSVELSFFLQLKWLPINLCPAIKNYKSKSAFPLYRVEVGKVQLQLRFIRLISLLTDTRPLAQSRPRLV